MTKEYMKFLSTKNPLNESTTNPNDQMSDGQREEAEGDHIDHTIAARNHREAADFHSNKLKELPNSLDWEHHVPHGAHVSDPDISKLKKTEYTSLKGHALEAQAAIQNAHKVYHTAMHSHHTQSAEYHEGEATHFARKLNP